MENGEMLQYAALIAVFAVLGFSIYTMTFPPRLEVNAQNFQAYETLRQSSAGQCGDLTDPSNIQHLSHHDDLKPCLDQVDPALRRQVLGW